MVLADNGETVRVVVSGDVDSLLGVVAMMNSAISNAQHPLHFYVTLPNAIISHFRLVLSVRFVNLHPFFGIECF